MASDLHKVNKAKTRKGKKIQEQREPQLVESTKLAMFIRGTTANDIGVKLMKDLCAIKKPNSVFFSRKNDWRPFEDPSHIEFFSLKNDGSLFMFASHSKKRPTNLAIGRTYDNHILDMVEVGVDKVKLMSEFKTPKISVGCKPVLLFSGEAFETQHEYTRLKNLLIDFFAGPSTDSVRLAGLENVITVIAHEGKIMFRHYRVLLKKSGMRLPRVELEEIGPSFEMTLRRTQLASEDLFKTSLKQPKENKQKKVKNIEKSPLGTTFARVHMERQDYRKLNTSLTKVAKKHGGRKQSEQEGDPSTKRFKKDDQ
ncbi:Ribosome production factor 2 -like protein [Halotydeus destructor]|nr:Ribosome production factor 2 -like protein [Halotydeus destructor]